MPSMIENVFIFGVILPALITITVFVTFLICWFKCNIRQKLQGKFPFCRKKTQGAHNSTTSAGASPKGVHYIQENLDCGSSSLSHDRNSIGESQRIQAIPMHDTGHLANMGFEIGEDFHSNYSGSGRTRSTNVDQSPAGPSTSQQSPNSYSFARAKPISSSSPVERRSVLHKSCDKTDNVSGHLDSVTVLSESNNVSGKTRHTTPDISEMSHTQATSSATYPSPVHSAIQASEEKEAALSPRGSTGQWGTSPRTSSMCLSSDVTPGVHKPLSKAAQPQSGSKTVTPAKRVPYVQQVFQFPHSSKHHKALTKVSRNPTTSAAVGASSSLDNSSSSYSSSNDGDFFDREGDYGQFYPISQHTADTQPQKAEVMYTRGTSGRNSSKQSQHRNRESVTMDTSHTNYQQGERVTKAVYYTKQPIEDIYHGGPPHGENFKRSPYTQDVYSKQNGLSSSQYSSQPFRHSQSANNAHELGTLHFTSQEV